jgi:cation diffusion facilitator family transporter
MRKVLWIALWVNTIVFIVQLTAAIMANSSALLADSIDMIGDVMAYAISLYAFNRGDRWISRASLFKGIIIAVLAIIVFIDASKKIFIIEPIPSSHLMLIFSVVGLTANSFCLWLLTKYRDENLNMKSVWICSRNDILVNVSVIIAAILIYYFNSQWPDVIVGLSLSVILLYSAYHITQLSIKRIMNKELSSSDR